MKILSKEICYRLDSMLKGKEEIQGTVHSVFNRVCNITFGDLPIVSLIYESLPMKPMAISLKIFENKSLLDLNLLVGQKVQYYKDVIVIPDANFTLYLKESKLVDSHPTFSFNKGSTMDVQNNIANLRLALYQGNSKGLLPIVSDFDQFIGEQHKTIPENIYSQFAFPRIKKLICAINQANMELIADASRNATGIGPGLTPSSDDMLIGLMISLIYASNYYNCEIVQAKEINSSIIEGAKGRTNQLSFEMMSFASQGEVTKNIHQLMSCIYSDSEEELHKHILSVMDYGETSGSDLLAGIYIGCKVCMDKQILKNIIT